MKSFFKNSYLAIIFLLLYTPILVLMAFSFNGGDSVRSWKYFSFDAYGDLFAQSQLWQSVSVTLIVAFISTFVAVIIGTFAALGLSKTRKLTRNLTLGITNIPLVNADIVTAVSLMLLFMALGFSFGLGTLILAHISFNIPYVIITVLPKIRQINISQLEASQDLGASPWYTLRKIVLPTIKPAIVAGAAIAFAMSFDDFLISYFTGGNTSNVSTFIYSLKRIKPYINAFSTIIIILITLIIISWNGYVVIKKQIKQRNDKIAKGIYHDQKITKNEKLLTKCYLQLNNFHNKKTKAKRRKSPYRESNFEIVNEQDIINAENRMAKNPKLIAQILKLEAKIETETIWINHIKSKISAKKNLKEERSKARREKYHFLVWPWKMIMISILLGSGFIGLGAFYIYTNIYDLSVANWGEYISPEILKGFEKEYQVKVKYTTYDDNESLYAKLYTTNYDLMVPSDYLVATLASEDRIINFNDPQYAGKLDFDPTTVINHNLHDLMENYQVKTINGTNSPHGLNDYSIPYFWGDVVMVINATNPNNLIDLGITNKDNADQAQWSILQTAAKKNKRIILNDDMHNLFMTALTDLHYKNKWGENKKADGKPGDGENQQIGNVFHDNINAHSNSEIDDAKTWLEPIITNSNTKLLNDNIVDEIAKPNNWDIAMMYNGDLLSAISDNTAFLDGKYLAIRPYMGTNIWNDDMVISKNSPHKELAFKFINYIMNKNQQVSLSNQFGYTSPLQTAMDEVSILYPQAIWKHVYTPSDGQTGDPAGHDSSFFNGLYHRDFDAYMQTIYNRLLAR